MKTFTREEIEKKVCAIISDVTWVRPVAMNELMRQDLGCDSLDAVDIVVRIEREFGITIPDNEIEPAAGWTVSEVCDYVEEKIKEQKK